MARINNGRSNKPAPPPGWTPGEVITNPNCNICTSAYRIQIEQELLMGHTVASICRKYQEEYNDPRIHRQTIETHKKKHMTLEQEALRQIIEERYEEHSGDVRTAMGILLGQKSVLEILAIKGYKSVLAGDTKVEVKDLILILQEISKMSQKEEDTETTELKRDFGYFVQAVQEIIPEDMYERIAIRFNQKLANTKPKLLEKLVDMKDLEILEAKVIQELEGENG